MIPQVVAPFYGATVPCMFQLVPVPITTDGRMIMAPVVYQNQCFPSQGLVPQGFPASQAYYKQDALKEHRKHHFKNEDDERLISIMEKHPVPLKHGEWDLITREMGGEFSVQQCRDRWHNYLKPPLDRSELDLEEKRRIVKEGVINYGHWKIIAENTNKNKIRSPALIKNFLVSLFQKMEKLGIKPETPEEVDYIPDVVFQWGSPRRDVAQRLREEFLARRSQYNDKRTDATKKEQLDLED